MSGDKCRCRECERARERELCYCRQCEKSRVRCRDKQSCDEKPKRDDVQENRRFGCTEPSHENRRFGSDESSCSNIFIQKYSPDCEKSSCDDQTKHIEIHNDHIIYITIR